jgi:L-ribulose-5-phosphate 3-epimerase
MEIMEKAILLSYDIGVRIIQLAGYDVYYNEKSTVATKERFLQNLYKSALVAAKYGIILALETMKNDFCNTIEKAMYFVKKN